MKQNGDLMFLCTSDFQEIRTEEKKSGQIFDRFIIKDTKTASLGLSYIP